jgi:MFS family permease
MDRGLRTFFLIWSGQIVSLLGTSLGSFALGVWIFERTRSATLFALMAFTAGIATLVVSPVAGSLADRLDRRRLLVISEAGSGLVTLVMALAFYTGRLEVWHVYPIVAALVGFGNLQGVCLTASVSVLVPRDQLARVSGIAQASAAVTQILGPLLAGVLVGRIGYHGVILIDCASFLVAVSTLLLAKIPRLTSIPGDVDGERPSLLRDAAFGWRYIRDRPGLLALMLLFAASNFSLGFVQVLLTPLVLSFGTPVDLGRVSSFGSAGALLGGVVLSVWGGPRLRVWGVLGGLVLQALFLIAGGSRPSLGLISFAAFAFLFASPIVNGCNQAIWQSKVALGAQGRVFAMRGIAATLAQPLSAVLAGPLADRVFNPMLVEGGPLAASVGHLIGTGPGRGIGLMLIVFGALLLATTLLGAADSRLRKVESDLADAPLWEPEEGPGVEPETRPVVAGEAAGTR